MFDAGELGILSQEIRNAISDGIRQGFEGLEVKSTEPGSFRLSHEGYIRRIEELAKERDGLNESIFIYRNTIAELSTQNSVLKRELKQGGD